VWKKGTPFSLRKVLEDIQTDCDECETGMCYDIPTYRLNVGVSIEELEFDEYVAKRNRRTLMKKVLSYTDYRIFIRIVSPFANLSFKRID
jgi:hypothetical protein